MRNPTLLSEPSMRQLKSICSPRLAAAFVFTLLGSHAMAQTASRLDEDFDDSSKSWQEIALQLPKAPNLQTLLPFDVSATATQTFSVAPESVTAGADGVVRFILVAQSASGARNISYEGLRCASLEYKLYAFGHEDGSWTRSRRDGWTPISGGMANREHAALADGYFCDGHAVAGSVGNMLQRLRRKNPINPRIAQ